MSRPASRDNAHLKELDRNPRAILLGSQAGVAAGVNSAWLILRRVPSLPRAPQADLRERATVIG